MIVLLWFLQLLITNIAYFFASKPVLYFAIYHTVGIWFIEILHVAAVYWEGYAYSHTGAVDNRQSAFKFRKPEGVL